MSNENIETKLEVDLEEFPDFFRIYGVNFKGDLFTVDLAKTRNPKLAKLNLKKEKCLDEVIERKSQEQFTIGSAPLYANTLLAIAELRKQPRLRDLVLERVRQTIGKAFLEPIKTTSVVIYKPDSDKVVHNYSFENEHVIETDLLGESGYLDTLKDANKISKALFEVGNAFQLNWAMKWLTGRGIYIHRFNDAPNNTKLRAVNIGNDIYLGALDPKKQRSRERWWNWSAIGIKVSY